MSAAFFARFAQDLSKRMEAQANSLQKRRDELRAELQTIESQIVTAQNAATRASIYPITAGQSMCPECWMAGKENAYLDAVGGGTDHSDFYRCGTCRSKFEVPFR